MRQVLFWIPVPGVHGGIPVFGYGVMLCLAFLLSSWVAGRRADREGINRQRLYDLGVWILIFGIAGARTTYLLMQEKVSSVWQFAVLFLQLWEGGIILYGAVIGGLVGYGLAYWLVLRPYQLSTWKVMDIIAPSAALGLSIGRVGCLLNGCCYGAVDHAHWRALHFPLPAPARYKLTEEGLQTAAGFLMVPDSLLVSAVQPRSPADRAGLRPGDRITAVEALDPLTGASREARPVETVANLETILGREWPRGASGLRLSVYRGDEATTLPTFVPRSLGLHPTQIYETISMGLTFLLLMAYYPFRRRDGQVMALLMLCYGAHRCLNEQLRSDFRPGWFETAVSISLIVAGAALWLWMWRQPAQHSLPGGAAAA